MAATPRSARPRARPGSAGEKKRRPWWHYILVIFGLLVLGGAAWGGYAVWFALTHVRASYARVTGLVVNVAAKADTRVQRVLVRTGDQVTEGQVVVLLDKADLEAAVEQAKANLAARESALARAERELELTIREAAASIEQAEAELAAAKARLAQSETQLQMQAQQQPDEVRHAEADLASATSELEDAEATLQRMSKLFDQGAISEQGLDAARTDYHVAQAAVAAAEAALAVAKARDYQSKIRQHEVATRAAEELRAKAGLKSAQTQERRVALREQEVLAGRAAVAEAKAALDAADVRLSDAVLRSPVNGAVITGPGHSVKDGEVVETGAPIVTVVATGQPLWISAAVSELYVDRVREGQPVLIRMDAFGRRWFHGSVEKVGRATEFPSAQASPWMMQHVPVKVNFDPEGKEVKHGMTCRVWVDMQRR